MRLDTEMMGVRNGDLSEVIEGRPPEELSFPVPPPEWSISQITVRLAANGGASYNDTYIYM